VATVDVVVRSDAVVMVVSVGSRVTVIVIVVVTVTVVVVVTVVVIMVAPRPTNLEPGAGKGTADSPGKADAQTTNPHRSNRGSDNVTRYPCVDQRRHRHVSGDARRGIEMQV
jgi:hypothetical protein